jgi:hypothetical protein
MSTTEMEMSQLARFCSTKAITRAFTNISFRGKTRPAHFKLHSCTDSRHRKGDELRGNWFASFVEYLSSFGYAQQVCQTSKCLFFFNACIFRYYLSKPLTS